MNCDRFSETDPRIQSVLAELKGMILARWPMATFEVSRGAECCEVDLAVIIDIDDTDEVMDLVVDRLLEIQIDEGLPVHVIPLRPMWRTIEHRRARGVISGDQARPVEQIGAGEPG